MKSSVREGWLIDIRVWKCSEKQVMSRRTHMKCLLQSQLNTKNVLTITNHTGFISIKLDYFCYFGAKLNFFVKLWRTKRSYYINHQTPADFSHCGGWVIDSRKEEHSFSVFSDKAVLHVFMNDAVYYVTITDVSIRSLQKYVFGV